MKKIMITLLLGVIALTSVAQEKVYQIDEVSAINYGDGRLLFRQANDEKAPINGEHRLIDGYRSEYYTTLQKSDQLLSQEVYYFYI